jgi:hypothetical protein
MSANGGRPAVPRQGLEVASCPTATYAARDLLCPLHVDSGRPLGVDSRRFTARDDCPKRADSFLSVVTPVGPESAGKQELQCGRLLDFDIYFERPEPLTRQGLTCQSFILCLGLSTRRFSRRTILAANRVLECVTQGELTRFLPELGPEFPRRVRDEPLSKTKRLNAFMGVYDEGPDRLVEGGDGIQDAVVERAALLVRHDLEFEEDEAPPWYVNQQEFCHRLEMDGFVISGGKLRASLPDDVDLPATQDELHRLLTKHKMSMALGHLDQALHAHAKGKWASANGQIRTFFDALLDESCERIEPNAKALGSGQPRRTQLAAKGFLSRELNEWGDNGLAFINGLVKRLHPQGSHPGLSDPDDSTFRLHVVLLTARFFLRRFDTSRAP